MTAGGYSRDNLWHSTTADRHVMRRTVFYYRLRRRTRPVFTDVIAQQRPTESLAWNSGSNDVIVTLLVKKASTHIADMTNYRPESNLFCRRRSNALSQSSWTTISESPKELHYGRMLQSGKLPVLNLLTGQKSGFSPAGATGCTDSRQTWHGRRSRGSACLRKISPQSPQGGGNAAPKISKISTFW